MRNYAIKAEFFFVDEVSAELVERRQRKTLFHAKNFAHLKK